MRYSIENKINVYNISKNLYPKLTYVLCFMQNQYCINIIS